MRRILLAILAGFGVLAAGCTSGSPHATATGDPSPTSVPITSQQATHYPHPSSWVAYMEVGEAFWLSSIDPFIAASTGCVLNDAAEVLAVDYEGGVIPEPYSDLFIEKTAKDAYRITMPDSEDKRAYLFSLLPNQHIYVSDGACPQVK
jgi:hypothetical protein